MQENNDFIKAIESRKAASEAGQLAREAIWEAYPDAKEVDDATEGMYEFDAIDVLDPVSECSHVSIMHDPEANTFALVEHLRAAEELVRQAEHETLMAALVGQVELKVMMLMQNCCTEGEVAAAWAATHSAVSQSARLRLEEIGGSFEKVVGQVDRFFLTNPQ